MEIEIPENMADLSAEELTALIGQLTEAGAELAKLEGEDADDETLVAVAAALEEAEAAFAAIEPSAADAARARFATSEDAPVEDAADKTEELSTEDAPTEDAADKTEELSTEDADEDKVDESVEAPASELTVNVDLSGLEKVVADALAAAATPAPTTPAPKKVSGLSLKRAGAPDDAAPKSEDTAKQWAKTVATDAFGNGTASGSAVTISELANSISNKSAAMSGTPVGFSDRITLAQSFAQFDDSRTLTGDVEADFELLKGVSSEHSANQALVASGGNCAPLQVSYEFTRKAEPQSPVENCLPVVAAPRGGIRYIPQTNFRDAAGGVRITTEAQDAAGYTTGTPAGPTPPKPCVRVTCPAIQECRVDAISQCVTFGNLNFRAFPEQVESFLQDLAVIYAETKERYYLDAMDAASVNVTSGLAFGYGMIRDLINDLTNAATAYRRRNNMSDGAALDIYLPSWIAAMANVDALNDHSMGLSFLGTDVRASLEAAFRTIGINVCWYYHGATGAGQDFAAVQADGTALNPWPTQVVAYIHCPGAFVRLNGGTLDLGVVRDSTLNGTNDLQIFAEEWLQLCHLGQEAIKLTMTVCPNGSAPEPAVLATC